MSLELIFGIWAFGYINMHGNQNNWSKWFAFVVNITFGGFKWTFRCMCYVYATAHLYKCKGNNITLHPSTSIRDTLEYKKVQSSLCSIKLQFLAVILNTEEGKALQVLTKQHRLQKLISNYIFIHSNCSINNFFYRFSTQRKGTLGMTDKSGWICI